MASNEISRPPEPFDLSRFIDAQAKVFADVIQELKQGQKQSHWMWFIFPQLRGLGRSPTAHYYGLESAHEAEAYVRDPLLGPRLDQTTQLVLEISNRTVHEIFGSPDDLKFRSCMTLFEWVAPDRECFALALEKYFGGNRDAQSLSTLRDDQQTNSPNKPTK